MGYEKGLLGSGSVSGQSLFSAHGLFKGRLPQVNIFYYLDNPACLGEVSKRSQVIQSIY